MNQTSVPLEIERKFLIRYPDLSLLEQKCTRKISISQTYLASEDHQSRRIRKLEYDGKTEYRYTAKVRLSDMTRIEREWEITEEEYLELMKEARTDARTILKTRYHLPSGKHCFEIDLFPEWKDRAFAEVELKDESETFEFPNFLSLIKEVTADRRYTNLSLAVNGFVNEPLL